MILVDTSLWVDHLRRGHPRLTELLSQGLVAGHPFVTGEIALGNLRQRDEILGLLAALWTTDRRLAAAAARLGTAFDIA